MAHPYFDLPTPVILGHRGAAGVAPENTLESFVRGLADGAQIIESDVHGTRDDVPVLIHDPDVDRTTNGRGAVSRLALADLQALDAAHHFADPETGAFPMRGKGVVVPSLEQALQQLPGVRFNLEIKAAAPGLIRNVVELVRACGREDRTLLTAGDDAIQTVLRATLKQTGVRPALGASLGDILAVIRSAVDGGRPATDSMAIQIPRDFGGRPLVTPALIEHAHAHGIHVHVWTINEIDEMRALLDLGVDGIVTDHPARMAGLLASRGAGRA